MTTVLKRNSLRLKNYDYSAAGYYFVTICVQNRECLFGNIVVSAGPGDCSEMRLSEQGKIVLDCWMTIPSHFPNVVLDVFVIMPNHFHGILIIKPLNGKNVGAGSPRPNPALAMSQFQGAETAPLRPVSLGQIVGYFKYQSTKHINLSRNSPSGRIWQRNYHDRIIRDEKELFEIRKYIEQNPAQWHLDPENPETKRKDDRPVALASQQWDPAVAIQ